MEEKNKILTYISLFSSAGVGCYGFKEAGFQCIATNEIIPRRLEIQKFNKKCKYESGYICGDITQEKTKNELKTEIKRWKEKEKIDEVDVVIATPPCQGMSVANHKKSIHEIKRNSLVIESVKLIKEIKPKVFIIENVSTFLKTICTDLDGKEKKISDAIKINLSKNYNIFGNVINFKNYGSNSSRNRTLIIGTRNDINIDPKNLFPKFQKEKTLKQVIGKLKSLKKFNEFDSNDSYHFFRPYPEYMREWISNTPEGKSAFDNKNPNFIPHKVINGKIVFNKNKNGDKYTRQSWSSVGPCIHTRNDQLASQNTVHPIDDRVFSIRELMLLMTIPKNFKWSSFSLDEINKFTIEEKIKYFKKEEIKIRQSIGEAVPTIIFEQIANNIKNANI